MDIHTLTAVSLVDVKVAEKIKRLYIHILVNDNINVSILECTMEENQF